MFHAAILGFIGAMIPGPLLSALFTEILGKGFKKSLKTIFYALIAELALAFLIIHIFSYAPITPLFFGILSLVGALVLLWISKGLWKTTSLNSDNVIHFTFSKISLLTFTNGLFWTYWVSVCIPMAFNLDQRMRGGKFVFLAMIESGWLFGTVLVCYLFSNFRPLLLKENVIKITFKAFSLMFIFFAFNMLYKAYVSLF